MQKTLKFLLSLLPQKFCWPASIFSFLPLFAMELHLADTLVFVLNQICLGHSFYICKESTFVTIVVSTSICSIELLFAPSNMACFVLKGGWRGLHLCHIKVTYLFVAFKGHWKYDRLCNYDQNCLINGTKITFSEYTLYLVSLYVTSDGLTMTMESHIKTTCKYCTKMDIRLFCEALGTKIRKFFMSPWCSHEYILETNLTLDAGCI